MLNLRIPVDEDKGLQQEIVITVILLVGAFVIFALSMHWHIEWTGSGFEGALGKESPVGSGDW